MTNTAFVLKRLAMPGTLRLERKSFEPNGKARRMYGLVQNVSRATPTYPELKDRHELYYFSELGNVAGIMLYSNNGGDFVSNFDIILVPELRALAVRHDRIPTGTNGVGFEFVDVFDLYKHGDFEFAPPRSASGVEDAVLDKLEELALLASKP